MEPVKTYYVPKRDLYSLVKAPGDLEVVLLSDYAQLQREQAAWEVQWTRERPAKPGYYWYQEGGDITILIDGGTDFDMSEYSGEWAGPLAPPTGGA